MSIIMDLLQGMLKQDFKLKLREKFWKIRQKLKYLESLI